MRDWSVKLAYLFEVANPLLFGALSLYLLL